MLREIYMRRYGKALAVFVIAMLTVSLQLAGNTVKNWHSQQAYYRSDDFQKSYVQYPENKQHDLNIQQEIQLLSYVFVPITHMGTAPTDDDFEAIQEQYTSFDPQKDYYSRDQSFGDTLSTITLILVGLAGFLLFFVDQKTAFNRFLFSLPVSRQKLFRSKFCLLGSVILGSALLGQLLYVVITYWGIPQPYMNVPLAVYFMSLLQIVGQNIVIFTISAFMGSMLGNLVFGPLTWLCFMALSFMLRITINAIGGTLDSAFSSLNDRPSALGDFLLVSTFGKNPGYWWMPLVFLLISLLIFFWAEKKYTTLSLEHDGDYLLHHESRPIIWGMMTIYTSLVVIGYWLRPFELYLLAHKGLIEDTHRTFVGSLLTFLVELSIIAAISFVIVYFSAIKNHWRNWRDQRLKNSLV